MTVVRSGEKVNVIPSEAVLELDGRLLPGFGHLKAMVAELEDLLGKRSGASARRSTIGNPPSDTGGTAAGSHCPAGFTLRGKKRSR